METQFVRSSGAEPHSQTERSSACRDFDGIGASVHILTQWLEVQHHRFPLHQTCEQLSQQGPITETQKLSLRFKLECWCWLTCYWIKTKI